MVALQFAIMIKVLSEHPHLAGQRGAGGRACRLLPGGMLMRALFTGL